MHYPHRTVVGIGFFLLAAVFIKCLHYKLLITTFSLQIQSTQLSIQDLFGLWLYCITYGATCQLAMCAASRSHGVFILNSGVILHERGRATYGAGRGAERGWLCRGHR